MVARLVRDQKVAGSNPVTSTKIKTFEKSKVFSFLPKKTRPFNAPKWHVETFIRWMVKIYDLQGDVVALIDANGTQVVEYGYDVWGNPISKSGSMVATLGTENLFRYREYVYDEETKLYYNKECGIDGEKSLNEVKGELK